MIDLHTHILPAIDDGPKSVEEALEMTEELYKQEVRAAVCTPHFDPTKISLEYFLERRENALLKMKDARIDLIPASETFLHAYLFHYTDLSRLCIENTRYLLLELPFWTKYDNKMAEYLDRLINYYGIIPIIAHIERYPAVKIKHIKVMKELGCMIQMNTSMILNRKTRKKAFRYIKRSYVDVIGSDCHNNRTRPPVMLEAYHKIRDKLGEKYTEKLDFSARSIINGTDLRKQEAIR